MANLHIYATADEVIALNTVEAVLTAKKMTKYPRKFALAGASTVANKFDSPNELIVYIYNNYDNDGTGYDVREIKSGFVALKELRSVLSIAGWLYAEKLGLREKLLGFKELTNCWDII